MDFTVVHAHWFLLCLALAVFPRISTACMAIYGALMLPVDTTYRVLWVLGWILTPRLLVAILAMAYFNTNPVLVILAWIVAFAGETNEKKVVIKVKSSE